MLISLTPDLPELSKSRIECVNPWFPFGPSFSLSLFFFFFWSTGAGDPGRTPKNGPSWGPPDFQGCRHKLELKLEKRGEA